MNILNKELLEDQDKLIEFFNEIENFIELNLEMQKEHKKIFLSYTNKIIDMSTENLGTEIKSIDIVIEFLNKLKLTLAMSDEIITNLENIKNRMLSIMQNLTNIDMINTFIIEYYNLQKSILENNIEITKFMNYATQFISLCFALDDKSTDTIEDNSTKEKNETSIKENSNTKEYIENTLIISEMQQKVLLPFTLKDLDNILVDNSNNYQNYDEIIENIYTIPYSEFKNPFISRFKEAFKLVKNKEHHSTKEAFELGMELIFNYNLHPAIIAACRNLDELDIYLDYLDNSETDKFDCFKIKFEIAPILTKK